MTYRPVPVPPQRKELFEDRSAVPGREILSNLNTKSN